LTLFFQALGMVEHRAADVIADVMQLVRFTDRVGVHELPVFSGRAGLVADKPVVR
jgi:hypothetical protein